MAKEKRQIVFVDADKLFLDKAKNFSPKLNRTVTTVSRIEDLLKLLKDHGSSIDVVAINIDSYSTQQITELRDQTTELGWNHIKFLSISEPQSKCSSTVIEKIKRLAPVGLINKSQEIEVTLFQIHDAIFYDKPKRKNKRIIFRVPVKCQFNGNHFDAETYSLSRDGIYIQTEKNIPHDKKITITFSIPEMKETFEIPCKILYELRDDMQVFRIAPSGIGLVFEDLPQKYREKIDKFIKEFL